MRRTIITSDNYDISIRDNESCIITHFTDFHYDDEIEIPLEVIKKMINNKIIDFLQVEEDHIIAITKDSQYINYDNFSEIEKIL